MKLDEVLGRVTSPEDKQFLEDMIKNQNSYITKLEAQLKSTAKTNSAQETNSMQPGMPKATQQFLERKMKEDTIKDATKAIKDSGISDEVFNAVESDWLEFLKNNMTIDRTTQEYAVDAFHLVHGRCIANKDHAIHKIGKTDTPNGTPPQNQNVNTAGTNAQGVQEVNNLIRSTPPTMTGNDLNAQSGIPTPQGQGIKNTKSAFDSLAGKFGRIANPFGSQ